MSVTNPMTTARLGLISILKSEFATEGYEVVGDILHRSLGRDGRTRIGVSPATEQPWSRNTQVMEYNIEVQFYGAWNDKIDPSLMVDPTDIETKAERFKRALRTGDPHQDNLWYYDVQRITYPHDPTGNATRFEAVIRATGTNSALVETTG